MTRPATRPATLLEAVEAVFYVCVLLLMSEALLAPLFTPKVGDPPAWLQLMWLPIYGVMTGLLVLRAPRLGGVWIGAAALAPVVLLAFASVQWSVAPDITLRRSVALLYTSAFGLLLAARYGWRGLIELFAATYLILAVGSLVAVAVFPAFGVHAEIHPGAWRGLWGEKNLLGAAMAKGALACVAAAMVAPARRWLWLAGVALCGVLVILSTSATSLIALLLIGVGAIALLGLQRGGATAVAMAWAVVVAGLGLVAVLLFAPTVLLEAVGKEPTLTGRTDIWASLMRQVEQRPWDGYGYGAFWAEKQGPAWYVRRDIQWNSPTAHNGWLDVLVQLGWTGLILFAAHFALATAAAGRTMLRGGVGVWAALSTGLFALFSLSESTILQQNNLNWVIYVATVAKLLERPTRARAGVSPYLVQTGRALAGAEARGTAASLRRTSAAP